MGSVRLTFLYLSVSLSVCSLTFPVSHNPPRTLPSCHEVGAIPPAPARGLGANVGGVAAVKSSYVHFVFLFFLIGMNNGGGGTG